MMMLRCMADGVDVHTAESDDVDVADDGYDVHDVLTLIIVIDLCLYWWCADVADDRIVDFDDVYVADKDFWIETDNDVDVAYEGDADTNFDDVDVLADEDCWVDIDYDSDVADGEIIDSLLMLLIKIYGSKLMMMLMWLMKMLSILILKMLVLWLVKIAGSKQMMMFMWLMKTLSILLRMILIDLGKDAIHNL